MADEVEPRIARCSIGVSDSAPPSTMGPGSFAGLIANGRFSGDETHASEHFGGRYPSMARPVLLHVAVVVIAVTALISCGSSRPSDEQIFQAIRPQKAYCSIRMVSRDFASPKWFSRNPDGMSSRSTSQTFRPKPGR
jgi:hypothetical protein